MGRALGRYEILRPLARGGMAEVFLARRRVAGAEKRLVIKRIRPERAADPRFLELFVREAKLSMALAHQNIVPVFDFGRVGDDLFLAMEEVEGHDLGATMARLPVKAIEPLYAAFIAAECAAALDYAHRRRGPDGEPLAVVHRDVSPRNILLSYAGEVKLVDFGVAALAGEVDASLRGTPAYMAPEQARREPVDGRSDLYALGLVLWELLVGRRARGGTDSPALLAEARAGTIAAPVGVPDALVAVLAHATAPSPGDRYASAREMHDDLDAFVAAERARRPELGAPRRRLAEWLAAAWAGEERPTSADDDAALAADGRLVTFVDDGADEVLGRTHRSIAETIGPEEAAEADEPLLAPAPVPAPAPAPAPASRRSRAPWIAIAISAVAIAVAAIAIVPALTRTAPAAPPAADPTPSHAAPAPAPPPAPTAPAGGSATQITPAPSPPVPAPAPAPIKHVTPKHVAQPPPPAPAAAPRAVTIGATPWASFTIDDDPTAHETPETVRLTPGRHLVHFDNPTLRISRTTPIDVPADHDTSYVEHMDR